MNQHEIDFSDACYENSLDELNIALANGVDVTDIKNWGITGIEWERSIRSAIQYKEENQTN